MRTSAYCLRGIVHRSLRGIAGPTLLTLGLCVASAGQEIAPRPPRAAPSDSQAKCANDQGAGQPVADDGRGRPVAKSVFDTDPINLLTDLQPIPDDSFFAQPDPKRDKHVSTARREWISDLLWGPGAWRTRPS